MSTSPNCIVVVSVPNSKARLTKMLRYRLENKTCLQGVKARFVFPPIGEKIHIVAVRDPSSEAGQTRSQLVMHIMQEYLDSFVEEVSKIKKRSRTSKGE